ncbi:MAG: S-layer homology domain-containing protein [Clostridia bacterium]|nr:S-layer homology domain-containing protein [Clostridia bacterium]
MKNLLVCIALTATLSLTCYADSITEVKQDRITGMITVTGKYDNAEIFKPEFAVKIFDEDNNIKAVEQNNKLNDNKSFSFEVEMDAKSGKYTVLVNSNAFSEYLTEDFYYVSSIEISEIIEKLNNTSDASSFREEFIKNVYLLGLDDELLKNISETDVCEDLYKQKPYEDIVDVTNKYIKSTVEKQVIDNGNKNQVAEWFNKYESELGLSEYALYSEYKDLSENNKQKLVSKISKQNKDKNFEEKFNESVILTVIETADSYGKVGNILNAHKDIVYNKDISEYFSKTNTASIDNKLIGKSYNTITELQSAIKELLNGSGQQGGGSGGSGSSGGGNSMPVVINNNTSIPVPVEESLDLFDDIENVEWAKVAINTLAKKGIINGKNERVFDPDSNVTREEFVKMLIGAFGINTENITCYKAFNDVIPGEWYEKYVMAGVYIGAINGKNENEFGIGEAVTRQDMAVMAYRFSSYCNLKFSDNDSYSIFTDRTGIADYAKQAVSGLVGAKIINGMDNGSFEAKSYTTRAQAAVVIYRLLNYMNGEQI